MVNYNETWLGKLGGGFGLSAGVGVGVYQVNLFCMNGSPIPIRALIIGKRLGLTLQAETAHAVCLMTGVTSGKTLTEIKSRGLDWALDIGINLDAFLKPSSQAAEVFVKLASKATDWAAQEATKQAVNSLLDSLSLPSSGPGFLLLPTPAAIGIGAGIYYEWQTLTKVGSDPAWDYVKPKWSLQQVGGKVLLKMENIPEEDETRFVFHIREKIFGSDNLIRFARPGVQNGDTDLIGVVRGGKLMDPDYSLTTDGFDLTSRQPVGKTTFGMLTVGRNTDIKLNGSVEIGISVSRGTNNDYRWASDDYAKIGTDGKGKFVSTTDTKLKD